MAEAAPVATDGRCRLCGGAAPAVFARRVLGRLDVTYYRCAACASLQTQAPTWLAEAYGPGNLATIDAGAAQRSLFNAAAAYLVARLFGLRDIVDFGGGDGLLCRLLRDQGLDAYVRDQYAAATYAQGYTEAPFAQADLVTAFEVVEHFAQPDEDLQRIFGARPRFALLTTELYAGQGPDWWYLAPASGQHVFFYSRQAMLRVGERFGYRVVFCPHYILLARLDQAAAWRLGLLQRLLRGSFLRLVLAAMFLRPARGAWTDRQRLEARRHGAP